MITSKPTPASIQTEIQVKAEDLSKVIVHKTLRTVILDNVSFSVPAGALFAINGPSGSGKSTLLNILTGIDRPSSGRIFFANQELQKMSENKLAQWRGHNVGIVFQFFQLIPTLTAQENILLALELGGQLPGKKRKERAEECLHLVDLENYAQRLPAELSGGQQQRVAIARALANDPPLLVADEPTGNLDSRSAHQIFDLLKGLTEQGKTVIYVTHDRELAERAGSGITLLDGSLV